MSQESQLKWKVARTVDFVVPVTAPCLPASPKVALGIPCSAFQTAELLLKCTQLGTPHTETYKLYSRTT